MTRQEEDEVLHKAASILQERGCALAVVVDNPTDKANTTIWQLASLVIHQPSPGVVRLMKDRKYGLNGYMAEVEELEND